VSRLPDVGASTDERWLQRATIVRVLRSPALGRRARQLARYGTVSLISTAISLAVLGALVATSAMPAAWANVVATFVGTAPSFELNRRWVWGHTGQRSVRRQVVPFFALSFAGLGLSTLFVALSSHWAQGARLEPGAQALVAQCANLVGFGSLWLIQFVILDRVLFARRSDA